MSRRAPLIVAIAAAVAAIVVVVFLVLPKMKQVSKAKDSLTQAQQQQQALTAQLQSLKDAQQNAPELQKQLAKLATQVPPTADLPGMIRLLSDAADRSGIDFFSIAPSNAVADASGEFSIIPTAVTVNGEFFSLDEFLFRLESLPRAAKVINFGVAQGPDFVSGGASNPLELTITMTVEFYTTDSSAGPGSIPGPTQGTGGGIAPPPVASPTPTVSPTSATTASPATSPTASASPTPQGA